jgi:periplasmic protein TonB
MRLAVSTVAAAFVTFLLFWTMQAIITVGYQLAPGGKPLSIEFVRLRRDTTPPQTKREPPKREKPKQPPPPPDISRSRSSLDPAQGVSEIAPQIDPTAHIETGIGGGGGSDRDAVPLVRTDAEYPAQAEARGITGWVTVEFTIAKSGAVKDERVVASRPQRIFDSAALAAVRRWKYNPKIKDGAPVERPGMQITFEFNP